MPNALVYKHKTLSVISLHRDTPLHMHVHFTDAVKLLLHGCTIHNYDLLTLVNKGKAMAANQVVSNTPLDITIYFALSEMTSQNKMDDVVWPVLF